MIGSSTREEMVATLMRSIVPAGTIWEHADKLHKELTEKNNEVARLRELLHRAIEIADNYEISGLPRDGFMLNWKVNKHEFSMLKEKMKEAA